MDTLLEFGESGILTRRRETMNLFCIKELRIVCDVASGGEEVGG
jgi:hypothetical protein